MANAWLPGQGSVKHAGSWGFRGVHRGHAPFVVAGVVLPGVCAAEVCSQIVHLRFAAFCTLCSILFYMSVCFNVSLSILCYFFGNYKGVCTQYYSDRSVT